MAEVTNQEVVKYEDVKDMYPVNKEKFTVGYWKIRGLAQPIRMALVYGDKDFDEHIFEQRDDYATRADGGKGVWQAMKGSFGVNFSNLPYILNGDIKISESCACLMYAADYAGIHDGFTIDERAQTLSLVLNIQNIRNTAVGCFYGYADDKAKKKDYEARMKQAFAPWAGLIKGKFLLGDKICAADFHVAEMIYQHAMFVPSIFDDENGKKLMEYMVNFFSIEQIKAYELKTDHPCNNKFAKWGGGYLNRPQALQEKYDEKA